MAGSGWIRKLPWLHNWNTKLKNLARKVLGNNIYHLPDAEDHLRFVCSRTVSLVEITYRASTSSAVGVLSLWFLNMNSKQIQNTERGSIAHIIPTWDTFPLYVLPAPRDLSFFLCYTITRQSRT